MYISVSGPVLRRKTHEHTKLPFMTLTSSMSSRVAQVVGGADIDSIERLERKERKQKKKEKKEKKKEKESKGKSKRKHVDDGVTLWNDNSDLRTKKSKRDNACDLTSSTPAKTQTVATITAAACDTIENCYSDEKMIQSSALDFCSPDEVDHSDTTLLLFYQYVEPAWDDDTYKMVLQKMEKIGAELGGRMRVAKEGLNCTLSGTHECVTNFCKALRHFHKGEFQQTEFKLTRDLPKNQRFPNLKVMPVQELVNYGLDGEKAPPLGYTGVHLEPQDYHMKLAEENTVVIDVRNHYEAAIGRFDPAGAEYIDPMMRKSTEFPLWLDRKETKEKLKGKQVLMYCTGGVRCERASALLKFKMEKDPEIKELGIKGVFQLQGGIDKYFKEFPEGGFWSGKNYTFDKRFAHAPPKLDGDLHAKKIEDNEVKGKCEACYQPWDKYRGKRRCPTCGVPSLICKDCFMKDKIGEKKLAKSIRCELCVEQNIRSKGQLKERELKEIHTYQENLKRKGLLSVIDNTTEKVNAPPPGKTPKSIPNPSGVTRLFLKNMCRQKMDESVLMTHIPGITHIVWRTDRKSGQFFGQAWVEMATSADAASAVGLDGMLVLGRPLYISFQPPDPKDRWPPPSSAVGGTQKN